MQNLIVFLFLISCMGIQHVSERRSLIPWKLSHNEGQRTLSVEGVGFMPQGPA